MNTFKKYKYTQFEVLNVCVYDPNHIAPLKTKKRLLKEIFDIGGFTT